MRLTLKSDARMQPKSAAASDPGRKHWRAHVALSFNAARPRGQVSRPDCGKLPGKPLKKTGLEDFRAVQTRIWRGSCIMRRPQINR
jgi:hypothetical protein